MKLILFVHPDFINSNSMPKFASMIFHGMKRRNHKIEIWTAPGYFYKLPFPAFTKKWLGYIDQFVIFPFIVKLKMRTCKNDCLFVFADHALGPWIPLVTKRPHIIHCHDFLAQRSASGEISENKLKISGKIYQKLIKWGYSKGKNFISVSHKTKEDLHKHLEGAPRYSEVIYNGLNQRFIPGKKSEARSYVSKVLGLNIQDGYILHVGGNQYYKNRIGVIEIYLAWRKLSTNHLPLLMVGPAPTKNLIDLKNKSIYSRDIYFLNNISDQCLMQVYRGAKVFLFPSLDEGFGWPIAEALASGCMVITTKAAPMTEVGQNSCFYIPRRNHDGDKNWSIVGAKMLEKVLLQTKSERKEKVRQGIMNAKRFDPELAMEKIEVAYNEVLKAYKR